MPGFNKLNSSLTDQPTFEYDESGKITGYKTKIGGADTVYPFNGGNYRITIQAYSKLYQNKESAIWGYSVATCVYKIVDGIATLESFTNNTAQGTGNGIWYAQVYSIDIVSIEKI